MSDDQTRVYEIQSIEDLIQIPRDRLHNFLHDLGAWILIAKGSHKLDQEFCDLLGAPPGAIRMKTDRFTWRDDGKTGQVGAFRLVDSEDNPLAELTFQDEEEKA